MLNAFLNLHVDDRFEIKFGRFFTPLTYDQYAISNYWMPTPERSLFTTNVGLGRQIGLMGWGYLFDKRLDYAAGIFNGSRNSFESLNNGVDFVAFLNARPFQESEALDFLRFLNLGTSVAFGYQDQPPVPVSFRIGGGSPNSRHPRGRHDPVPDPQPRRDRARRPTARVRPLGLLLQEPLADRRVAIRLRQLRVLPTRRRRCGPALGLLLRRGLLPHRRGGRAADQGHPAAAPLPDAEGAAPRDRGLGGRRSGQRASPRRRISSPPGSPTRISGPTRPSRRSSA